MPAKHKVSSLFGPLTNYICKKFHKIGGSKDGKRYEGCWQEGRRDGVGFVVSGNGDWFEGIWKIGKKEGPGLLNTGLG